MDDEARLPVVEGNDTLPRDQEKFEAEVQADDLPFTARRSLLYRAALPAKPLWRGGGDDPAIDEAARGQLQVWLPDGKLLLQHVFEPVRWLPSNGGGKDRVCEGLCIERHGVVRLCYALQHGHDRASLDKDG